MRLAPALILSEAVAPGRVGVDAEKLAPASTVGAWLSKAKALLEASLVILPAKSVAITAIFTVALLTSGGSQVVEVALAGKVAISCPSRKVPDRE